ncbi:TPA: hypothetical protein ACG6H0_005231, partial [Escherichia coli]|nr:hypothetical protein [Escherichia coli]
YSAATGGLIAVSELAKRVSGKTNRKLVATMLSLAVAGTVNAANIDISNVWARDYLDLALDWPPESPDNQYHLFK